MSEDLYAFFMGMVGGTVAVILIGLFSKWRDKRRWRGMAKELREAFGEQPPDKSGSLPVTNLEVPMPRGVKPPRTPPLGPPVRVLKEGSPPPKPTKHRDDNA